MSIRKSKMRYSTAFAAYFFLISTLIIVEYTKNVHIGRVVVFDTFPLWDTLDDHAADLNIWQDNRGGGAEIYILMWPVWLLWQIALRSGLGGAEIDAILAGMCAVVGPIGIHVLCRSLFETRSWFADLLATLFYAFNADQVSNTSIAVIVLRSLGPIIAAVVVILCKHNTKLSKVERTSLIVFYTFANLVFWPIISVNLAQGIAVILCIMILFAIGIVSIEKNRRIKYSAIIAKLIALTIFTNIYVIWIVFTIYVWPILNGIGYSASSSVEYGQWSWTHSRSLIINVVSGFGAWVWNTEISGKVALLADSSIIKAIVASSNIFIVICGVISSIKFIRYLSLFVMFLWVFMTGLGDIFGELNRYLLVDLGLVWIFREPISKLSVVVVAIMAVVLRLAYMDLRQINQPRRSLWLTFGFASWSLVAGTCLSVLIVVVHNFDNEFTSFRPPRRVQVPSDWYDFASYVRAKNLQGAHVFVLPLTRYYQVRTDWPSLAIDLSVTRLARLVEIQNISTSYIKNESRRKFIEQLYVDLEDSGIVTEDWIASVQRLGAEGILVRRDVTDGYLNWPNLETRIKEGVSSELLELQYENRSIKFWSFSKQSRNYGGRTDRLLIPCAEHCIGDHLMSIGSATLPSEGSDTLKIISSTAYHPGWFLFWKRHSDDNKCKNYVLDLACYKWQAAQFDEKTGASSWIVDQTVSHDVIAIFAPDVILRLIVSVELCFSFGVVVWFLKR